jgi:hypothetical protein
MSTPEMTLASVASGLVGFRIRRTQKELVEIHLVTDFAVNDTGRKAFFRT